MTNHELAKQIVALLGGTENILSAENCMTRIRVHVRDGSKTDIKAMKQLEGVLGVMDNEDNYIQIVLGPGKVRNIMTICTEELGLKEAFSEDRGDKKVTEEWKANKEAVKSGQSQSQKKLASRVRVLADIFTPMIPAFIASGISNGIGKIIGILITNGVLPEVMAVLVIQNIFVLIGNAFLSYMAIFTGVRSAKQFGVNEMLGGMIGAASLNSVVNTISQAVGWYDAETVNNSILSTNAGGIIGVVIGVWVLAKVERWVHNHMLEVLDVSFTPLLSMVVTMPVFVLVIMPITGYFSTLVASFLNLFIYSANPVVSVITGYVLAATFLPLVLLGLHRGLVPIYAIQIENMGGTTLFPAVAMAGAGQVGAAIALYIKAKQVKNERLKGVIRGALPAGVLGIGEPLIYGVTLPMMKPFITAGLGAGFGGAWCMFRHVMSTAYSPSGLLGTTIMLPECMLDFLIGLIIAYIAGAIITYLFIPVEDVTNV